MIGRDAKSPASSVLSRSEISFSTLVGLTGDQLGTFIRPCPLCSPSRKPVNQKKPVLKIWYEQPGFATFFCAHCAARGFSHDESVRRLRKPHIAPRGRHDEAKRVAMRERQALAQRLWNRSTPIENTFAERYLRHRKIICNLPATLRFLPANGRHPPAMIAAFGIPLEPKPGHLDAEHMRPSAVHITRLAIDGRGKAGIGGQPDKFFIGSPSGLPLVVAAPNDLNGLVMAEGIEDALTVHQETGLGAWAAGCAARMPDLAVALPNYVETVTILVDDNPVGRDNSRKLAERIALLRGSQFEIRHIFQWFRATR